MATVKKEEVEILSPEVVKEINTKIETSLVKENVTDKVIAQLQDLLSLTIKDQDDKEGFLAVQEARKSAKQLRVLTSKICKAGRAEANAISKAWVEKEKEVTGKIAEVEDVLQEREDAYLAEKDRLKKLRDAEIERQGIERVQHMVQFGAQLQGSNWVLGEVVFEAALVKEADPEIYQSIFDAFKAQFDVNEADRIKKEAADRLERENFQKQQDDLKRQQQEMRDMRTQARISFLESLGMKVGDNRQEYVYGRIFIRLSDIEQKDAQEWEVIIAGAREGIEAAKAEEEKRQAKILKDREDEKKWRDRLDQLKEVVWDGQGAAPKWDDGNYIFSYRELIDLPNDEFNTRRDAHNDKADERVEEAKKKQEEKRRQDLENARIEGIGKGRREMLSKINGQSVFTDFQLGSIPQDKWDDKIKEETKLFEDQKKASADKAERERQDLLGEKQRWEEYVAAVKAIKIPDVKSGQYRAKANAAKSFIDNLK